MLLADVNKDKGDEPSSPPMILCEGLTFSKHVNFTLSKKITNNQHQFNHMENRNVLGWVILMLT